MDWSVFGWAISWAFLLWLAYFCFRLKKAVARSDHLVVSNYLNQCRVPYDEIEEIGAGAGRNAVFVRLRLRSACRFGRAIHFLLPSILARIEAQPEVELLREKCPHLFEQSKRRWPPKLYLRPPANKLSREKK